MSAFSERLRAERKKAKLTQEQMANQLGITRAAYTLYETDKTQPTLETATKIAEILKTSLDYLTGRYS
ncbi:helix-turn-helix domain-containing protein [Oscillospiraceae bacterium LTW-04]|nr:helix-turn-helix transcriptional regulator [Oscillospiraceae bacterium MB24-C1]WMJ84450.1 helix-turn-helix transcriptional regulator [Oscillospiraceae bacterium MB24-C1]